ncbi:MAG: ABC transporter permease [Oscillospiraceae bacterium]|nr:ABC transporter permease [Oscillospiraceae bacterium]
MYLLGALKSIARNKVRNVIFVLVLTAIVAAATTALTIRSTASSAIADYRAQGESQARIVRDVAASRARYNIPHGTPVTPAVILPPEQVVAFAQSEYLYRYEITTMMFGGSNDIEAIGEAALLETAHLAPLPDIEIMPKFRVLGGVWDEFETGERVLFDGRMPQIAGEAMISQELAELNGFVIGDIITVTAYSRMQNEDVPLLVPVTLTISGIFYDNTEIEVPAGFAITIETNPQLNRKNEILTTADTLLDSAAGHPDSRAFRVITLSPVYYLRTPAHLPYFEAELREKGLDDLFLLYTSETAFNATVEPLEGLRSVLFTFVIVVLVLGAIILVILSSISIRKRKYEIGTLLAGGIKKGKVARSSIYEIVVLTAICLGLGIAAGTMVAQPVADNLLRQQVEIAESAAHPVPVGPDEFMRRLVMGPMNAPEGERLSEINVSLDVEVVIQITAIALLLAFIAGTIALVNIVRYEPGAPA